MKETGRASANERTTFAAGNAKVDRFGASAQFLESRRIRLLHLRRDGRNNSDSISRPSFDRLNAKYLEKGIDRQLFECGGSVRVRIETATNRLGQLIAAKRATQTAQ